MWCNPNSMILLCLPNFRTQFFHKEEAGSYDNIAQNQRNNISVVVVVVVVVAFLRLYYISRDPVD